MLGEEAAKKLLAALSDDAMKVLQAEMEKQLATCGMNHGPWGEVSRATLKNTGQYLLHHGVDSLKERFDAVINAAPDVQKMQNALAEVGRAVMGNAMFEKVLGECISTAMNEIAAALEAQGMEQKYVAVVQAMTMHMARGGMQKLVTSDAMPRVMSKVSALPQMVLQSPGAVPAD